MIEKEMFKYYAVDKNRLISFGFQKIKNDYKYSTQIVDNSFLLEVIILENGEVDAKILDEQSEEEYVLHRIPVSKGSFASKVKEAYEHVLEDIKRNCFDREVYKQNQTKGIIKYAKDTYQDELEFLWEDSPTFSVLRRQDTKKWYAIFMTIPKCKLGLDGNEEVEVMNLKLDVENYQNQDGFYPAYHMNKKYWMSILLDGHLQDDVIFRCVDESYQFVGKKKKK